MRKIRLSDTDLELFDIEISPTDYVFFQRHKDAFKTMFREQGKPFWKRFEITFRSFTVKHGVIKQLNIDSPKFQNLIDEAFIFIHEQFVDGKENVAKNFIEDIARLAQNQDKFPELDSKSFSKDPFYIRETRELFRNFFGPPDQKSSYLKVYILCPVYLRFGGSICRCLIRWVDAPIMDDPRDDSYWIPPVPQAADKTGTTEVMETVMCSNCIDECGTKYFREKIMGHKDGPCSLEFWTKGDPRFNDSDNPLFAPHLCPDADWRDMLTVDSFRDFYNYARYTYGTPEDRCSECQNLKKKRDKFLHVCRASKKKKKKSTADQQELIKDLKEVRDRIDELEESGLMETCQLKIEDLIKDKPRVREALDEGLFQTERKENLEKLHNENVKTHEEVEREKKNKKQNLPQVLNPNTPHIQTCKKSDFESQEEFNKKTMFKLPDGYDPKNPEALILGMRRDGTLALDYKRNHSTVSGFKVIKIEDENNTMCEVNISATSARNEQQEQAHFDRLSEKMSPLDINEFRMTAHFLRQRICGLPEKLEWWEGRGFVVAVLNYEAEEKRTCEKWTNFTIKVSGYEELCIKHAMMLLLVYVAKRKQRSCKGWQMAVDDVVTCLLPERQRNIEDLNVSIQRGFRFEDRLTSEERLSLVRHEQNMNFALVLVGIEKGDAPKILAEEDGQDKMRNIIEKVAGCKLFTKDLPKINNSKLRKKLNKTGELSKADILWEQLMRAPEQFEFFFLAEHIEEIDLWDMGMKSIDVRTYMSRKNPPVKICPLCKEVDTPCDCLDPKPVTDRVEKFLNDSGTYYESVRLREEQNNLNLPKMKYTETAIKMDDNKMKLATPLSTKEGQLELQELQQKCAEEGIIVDKAEIAQTSNLPSKINGAGSKLAQIPGVQSSLNFTFKTGKKEQTLCVHIGAYLPEDQLNELEKRRAENEARSAENDKKDASEATSGDNETISTENDTEQKNTKCPEIERSTEEDNKTVETLPDIDDGNGSNEKYVKEEKEEIQVDVTEEEISLEEDAKEPKMNNDKDNVYNENDMVEKDNEGEKNSESDLCIQEDLSKNLSGETDVDKIYNEDISVEKSEVDITEDKEGVDEENVLLKKDITEVEKSKKDSYEESESEKSETDNNMGQESDEKDNNDAEKSVTDLNADEDTPEKVNTISNTDDSSTEQETKETNDEEKETDMSTVDAEVREKLPQKSDSPEEDEKVTENKPTNTESDESVPETSASAVEPNKAEDELDSDDTKTYSSEEDEAEGDRVREELGQSIDAALDKFDLISINNDKRITAHQERTKKEYETLLNGGFKSRLLAYDSDDTDSEDSTAENEDSSSSPVEVESDETSVKSDTKEDEKSLTEDIINILNTELEDMTKNESESDITENTNKVTTDNGVNTPSESENILVEKATEQVGENKTKKKEHNKNNAPAKVTPVTGKSLEEKNTPAEKEKKIKKKEKKKKTKKNKRLEAKEAAEKETSSAQNSPSGSPVVKPSVMDEKFAEEYKTKFAEEYKTKPVKSPTKASGNDQRKQTTIILPPHMANGTKQTIVEVGPMKETTIVQVRNKETTIVTTTTTRNASPCKGDGRCKKIEQVTIEKFIANAGNQVGNHVHNDKICKLHSPGEQAATNNISEQERHDTMSKLLGTLIGNDKMGEQITQCLLDSEREEEERKKKGTSSQVTTANGAVGGMALSANDVQVEEQYLMVNPALTSMIGLGMEPGPVRYGKNIVNSTTETNNKTKKASKKASIGAKVKEAIECQKEQLEREKMRDEEMVKNNRRNRQKKNPSADEKSESGEESVERNSKREINDDVADKADILRTCGNCEKLEPKRKAFKKCQKCKEEGVLEVRYYCSRDCQVDDWRKRHKMEHQDGLLG